MTSRLLVDCLLAGGGALGHPLEYIMLANAKGEPVTCPYCGVRYRMKGSH